MALAEFGFTVPVSVTASLTVTTADGSPVDRVPDHLRIAMQPATHVLYEWDEYVVRCDGATQLRVGSRLIGPMLSGTSYFRLQFANQLGLSPLVALRDGVPISETVWVEVLAKKLGSIDHSVAFMQAILADLFATASTLPYSISTESQRWVIETHRPPTPLFTYHFFRQRVDEVRRAAQAVLGSPHRRLDEEEVRVRPHEVRHLFVNDVMRLLHAGAIGPDVGGTVTQRLRADYVHQRLPVETYDTPENRFIVAAVHAMLDAIERLHREPWFHGHQVPVSERRAVLEVDAHLRSIIRDRRFASLPAATRVLGQSRVLQRKDGYRDLTLLWQVFARARMPVFEHLQSAIDLRSIDAMYELWVVFAVMEKIKGVTSVDPTVHGNEDASGRLWCAVFPGFGELRYQQRFAAYSGVRMIPDVLWRPVAGQSVVLDAKFRVKHVDEVMSTNTGAVSGEAKSDDLVKMHAYRDGIAEVGAAIVVFPGSGTRFRSIDRASVDLTWEAIVAGDLEGVGALPMRPTMGW